MPEVTELRINGTKVGVNADAERPLLSVLRDDLDLTGAKYGCGEGQCGACTVLVDGVPTRSCITPVGTVAAKQITTIEGVGRNGKLHPVQEAFLEVGPAWGVAWGLEGFSLLAAARGQAARALQLAGGASALREALGLATTPLARDIFENKLAAARLDLTDEAAATAWACGYAMRQAEIVQYALKSHSEPARNLVA